MSGVELEMVGFDGELFLGENVYNPLNVFLFLRGNNLFKSSWFETATPTFLGKLLEEKQLFLLELSSINADEKLLARFL